LLRDLPERDYVRWGIAEVYNSLVAESGLDGFPEATRQTSTGRPGGEARRSRMTADEMRVQLGQLRSKLEAAS
jgi:hypothetical protein